tara:strand:+ start:95 stop:340 length:246 start_codon:yes stop_codon:yes gene_type:complete
MIDEMKEKTPYPILKFEEPVTNRMLEVVFGYVKGEEMIALFNGDDLIAIIGKHHLEQMITGGWQECPECNDTHLKNKHNHN